MSGECVICNKLAKNRAEIRFVWVNDNIGFEFCEKHFDEALKMFSSYVEYKRKRGNRGSWLMPIKEAEG